MMCIVMISYFSSLMIQMYSGANDNFTHSLNENWFDDDSNNLILSNANFLPSLSINMNDDLTDPMSIDIFQKEKT